MPLCKWHLLAQLADIVTIFFRVFDLVAYNLICHGPTRTNTDVFKKAILSPPRSRRPQRVKNTKRIFSLRLSVSAGESFSLIPEGLTIISRQDAKAQRVNQVFPIIASPRALRSPRLLFFMLSSFTAS